jgi:hypothetical protein
MYLTAMCGAREKTPCVLSSASGRSMVEGPMLQVLKEHRLPVTCRFMLVQQRWIACRRNVTSVFEGTPQQ